MNNRICPACKKENGIDTKFCSACGKALPDTLSSVEQNNNIDNNSGDVKTGNMLGIISLALYFAGSIAAITTMTGLFSLAGIVVMIIGRVKYPQNKVLKVAMWLMIITIIVYIIIMAFLIITCINTDWHGILRGCE